MSEVTRILSALDRGDAQAAAKLLPLVYDELRKLAAQRLAGEKPGQTLQATALVHEAYLRLVGGQPPAPLQQWNGRGHFFAAAAEAMRRILVNRARDRRRLKRGGGAGREELAESRLVAPEAPDDLLALDEAMNALAVLDERKSKVIELRFFGGLSVEETAEVLKVSPETVMRDWPLAKVWLLQEMTGEQRNEG